MKYETYEQIPLEVQGYVKFVCGVEDIKDIALCEINEYFETMNEAEKAKFEAYKEARKDEWDQGWVFEGE